MTRPSGAAIREALRRTKHLTTDAAVRDVQMLTEISPYRELNFAAHLIEKYEPETLVDPVVLRAREICKEVFGFPGAWECRTEKAVIRALREGMPK